MVIDKQPTQRVSIVNSLWTISLIFLWSWAEYDSYILEQALRLVSHHSFWLVAELCIICVCVCVCVCVVAVSSYCILWVCPGMFLSSRFLGVCVSASKAELCLSVSPAFG